MSIVSKFQSIFGVSRTELTVVTILLLGLIGGLFIKTFSSVEQNEVSNSYVYQALDSLAEAQKSTYTGTDINNNTYPELAQADTIVKKRGILVKRTLSGTINLNTASKIELMKIPGIGEKTAIKILEYRKKTRFKTPDDIKEIKGIGAKKFEKIKQYIEVK